MRIRSKYCLSGLAVLLFAVPALAHIDSSNFDVSQPMKVGNTELKPGNYVIKAEEGGNEMKITQDGTLIAEVPVHWTQLAKKSSADEFDSDNGRVTQIRFDGRTEAIQFND